MSIVFLGTSQFAAAILARLAQTDDQRPALVVTRPDRPSGRGRRLTPPPVAERAQELGLALAQPQSVNDPQARAQIARDGATHTVIVCAFGALITEPLLSEHNMLNVHPSLLPRWRGAAPVERAIMAGDEHTGVSIMRLTAGLDSGPVCLAAAEPILPTDTYGTLAARLQQLGGELLVRALREAPPFVEQDEHAVTYAEKILAEDRLLDPACPAVELERQVRALTPHIGARLALPDGAVLGVQRAALCDWPATTDSDADRTDPDRSDSDQADAGDGPVPPDLPGTLAEHDGRLLLRCAQGALELLVVQPPGGRAMEASAYLRGHGAPGRA